MRSIIIQQSSKLYLLVRYPDRYHIVDVRRLTDEAEEGLINLTLSEAEMDELGLKRVTLPFEELDGVTLTGCTAGDVLTLHTKKAGTDTCYPTITTNPS